MAKYILNRLGLVNFWYYENQTFELADGHLLLRGSNGAGKSVTMQSLMPVLLDGNTEPSRLDSFGSRARKMMDYLLGEEDVSGKSEATGYLWAEYRSTAGNYITTGIGLHGRRGGTLSKWFFTVEDNRRIGIDINLEIDKGAQTANTLTKRQLRNVLQPDNDDGHVHGQLFDDAKSYAEFVRTRIFGFTSVDDFNDTIRLLIQLRNPKLNKDFRPSDLEQILSDALPSLSDADVQASAQTLGQIDEANRNKDENLRQLAALKPLLKAYSSYGDASMVQLAHLTDDAQSTLAQQEAERGRLEEAIATDTATKQSHVERLTAIGTERETAREQQDELSANQGFELAKREQSLERKAAGNQQQVDRVAQQQADNQRQHTRAEAALTQLHQVQAEQTATLHQITNRAERLAGAAGYAAQHAQTVSLLGEGTKAEFGQWRAEVKAFNQQLAGVVEQFHQVDRYQQRVKERDADLQQQNARMEQLGHDAEQWRTQFDEESFRLKEALETTRSQLHFAVDETVIGTVQGNMAGIYTDEWPDWSSVLAPLRTAFTQAEADAQLRLRTVADSISQLDDQVAGLRAEQDAIRTAPYPVPDRTATLQARRKVNGVGVPFYQLIDFQPATTQELRGRIESALLASGLLDALVTPDDQLLAGDRVLRSQPQLMTQTLADYLQADVDEGSVGAASQVDDLLRSITVSDDAVAPAANIDPAGTFELGIMAGKGVADYEPQFIGATAQQRYREQQIADLERQIGALADQRTELVAQQQKQEDLLAAIKSDWQLVPSDDELHQINFNMVKNDEEIQRCQQQIDQLTQQLDRERQQLHAVREKLQLAMQPLAVEHTLAAYQAAQSALADYRDMLGDWQNALVEQRSSAEQVQVHEQNLANLTATSARLTTRLQELNAEGHQLQQQLDYVREQQQAAGDLAAIRQQISAIVERLRALDQEERQLHADDEALVGRLSVAQQRQETLAHEAVFQQRYAELLRQTLDGALRLRQTGTDDGQAYEARLLKEDVPDAATLSRLADNLVRMYNLHNAELQDYRPALVNRPLVADEPEWLADDAEHADALDRWREHLNQQMVVQVQLGGINRPLGELNTLLQRQVEDNSAVIDAQEELLFKDIIFEGLGGIIRQRINRAQSWVDQMNTVMRQQENNSGLKLSVKWTIRQDDEMGDVAGAEIVRLFQTDPQALNDASLAQMKTFLEGKINARKQSYEEHDQQVQMTTVLQEALDYRSWFEFSLFYTQNGKGKKPLTDATFNRFSGGEKAVTMYTPMFVSMYARYQNAGDQAPYIITLDEAFAGIDEGNIGELFKTIESLGFNYIMNSQQLQGEYAMVSSLNTYEILRLKDNDNEGNVVTTIKTHWDGHNSTVSIGDDGHE